MERILEHIRFFASSIGGIIICLGIIGGVFVFIYQYFLWLQLGRWVEIPAAKIIPLKLVGWAFTGDSWLGAKKIMLWIIDLPLFVFLPLAVFLCVGLVRIILNLDE
jgi:hypothetical protein